MAFLDVLIAAIALLVVAGEFLLGLVVLSSGAGRAAARFLGAFLLLHAALFIPESIIQLFLKWPETETLNVYETLWASGAAFLPPLLLGFALTYPSPLRRLARRPAWVGLLLLPSAIVVAAVWIGRFILGGRALGSSLLLLTVVALLGCVFVFRLRRRWATTALEASRLRWMYRALGIPLAATVCVMGAYGLLFAVVDFDAVPGYALALLVLAFLAFLFVPPVVLAYGLLRYHILDFDVKVRFTLQQSFVLTLFLVVFYVVSEGAQTVLADRFQSGLLGVVGAGALLFFLVPLEQAARRLAQRIVPLQGDVEKYREFQRWQVYRAAYEDVSRDQRVTPRERRLLASLAQSLGLDDSAARTIEHEVARERAAPRRRG